MGIMSSRAPGAASSGAAGLAPEPVDAPPPTQPVQGLSFKDAVLEPAGGKSAATSPRGKGAAKGAVQMTTPPAQPEGAPRGKRGEGEGEGKSVATAVAETTEAAARTTVAATGLWRPFRFLARTGEKSVDKLTRSQRFLNAVEETFKECDVDSNGRIAAAELYVAVLLLYHRINSWPLGGGLKKPPTRQEVLAALERHDGGGKGYLSREEFTAAAQDIFAHVARGVSKQIFVMVVLSPVVAHLTRKLVDRTIGRLWPALGEGFNKWVPDFIFAPALATTVLSFVTPILFDTYDRGKQARARSRAKRAAMPLPAAGAAAKKSQ